MLRFFVILRSAATKDPLLQRRGGHREKILRCAQDDRDESALEDRGRIAEKDMGGGVQESRTERP